MKQSELIAQLSKIEKAVAKEMGWGCSRGFVFKKYDHLFFTVGVSGSTQSKSLIGIFGYKWLEFDSLLWKITGLEENANKPLSFHATGVFVAPFTWISDWRIELPDGNPEEAKRLVTQFMKTCASQVPSLSSSIKDLDSNLAMIEANHASHLKSFPGSLTNIHLEKIFTTILQHRFAEAGILVKERMQAGDSGKFGFENGSIYDLCGEYIKKMASELASMDFGKARRYGL